MAIVCILLFAGIAYGFLAIKIMTVSSDLKLVKADLNEIQPTVDRIHEMESAKAQLMPKVTLLTKARESTLYWRNLMLDLSASLPDKTWLTAMTVTRDENGGTSNIALSGMSTKQALVGETMLRIGDHKSLKDVKLKYTNLGKLGKESTVNFELGAGLSGMEKKPQ
jgi:Tfp pilus assembly protein PilN